MFSRKNTTTHFFFFQIGTKEILHKVNGRLPGSQLTAIMGPSGAGKSTLLDVLSGYRKTGVNGAVYINGRIRNLGTLIKRRNLE